MFKHTISDRKYINTCVSIFEHKEINYIQKYIF